jgi:hypothetical protein
MHLGGVSLGGIAKGAHIEYNVLGSALAIGKAFATLQRALTNQESGVKLTPAQKGALARAREIEENYGALMIEKQNRKELKQGVRKARAPRAPGAPRKAKVSYAKQVKSQYPDLTADEVKRVVKRRQAVARREDHSLLLPRRLKKLEKQQGYRKVNYMKNPKNVKVPEGLTQDEAISDLLAVYGYGNLDLPLGVEGYDGEVIQAGARRRRMPARRHHMSGAGMLDLPLGVEGYDGEVIQAGARRRRVGRPRKSHLFYM